MAVPVLQSRVLYGLKSDVDGNVHYLTDTEILYPVGNALAFHNFSQRRQRLLRLPDKHKINIIAVTPSKKYVALCEIGEKPTISIYDAITLKRKKSLGVPYDAPGVTRFTCVSFSHDGRCLAAVTGPPDQTMLYYAWEKGKVESSVKLANPQIPESTISCVSCNPGDGGVVALGGLYAFKFLTVSETVWRPYGYAKSETLLVSSMAWLNTDRLLVGTLDGRVLYLENGDLKNVYKLSEANFMNLKIREEYTVAADSQTSLSQEGDEGAKWPNEIRCLVAFQRGFAHGFGPGRLFVWEREGQHKYTRRHVYVVPDQISKRGIDRRLYRINAISSNPSCDGILVTTGWSQLFLAKLWGPAAPIRDTVRFCRKLYKWEIMDVEGDFVLGVPYFSRFDTFTDDSPQGVGAPGSSDDAQVLPLAIMGQYLHHGSIGGLSGCAWKSVLLSFGDDDRSVRIWDYETESLLLTRQYNEDVYSVALHPSGLFCLIGFSDKLRFMTILVDDLSTIQEIPVRTCSVVSFSQGGHMFAAVNGNVIQIYSTVSFACRFFLKGHTGRVRSVAWSRNDDRLVSVGSEGAVYGWDTSNGRRTYEVVLKQGVSLNDVVLTADGLTAYCIANDDKIREIRENSMARELHAAEMGTRVLTMSKDDFGIFVGCPGGAVLFLGYPLQDPPDSREFHLHCDDVTCLCLSYDEKVLVSAGQDGTMCFWRVTKSEVTLTRDLEFTATRTNEILVGKDELEDKVRKIEELVVRIRESETEHAYKQRQLEIRHNEKIGELHRVYCDAIAELRMKIETIQEERSNEMNSVNVDIGRMKKSHEDEIARTETSYDAKLIMEYEKYRDLEERTSAMRGDYEDEIGRLERTRLEESEATRISHEARLHSKNLELAEAREETAHQALVHEELKRQIEDDADREIVQLRSDYEARLDQESRAILKLKGEAGVLRNKFFATRKEIDDLRHQVDTHQSEQTQSRKLTQDLERDVNDLKKEISERDSTIRDKEKRIYELKRDNQELEKFKFVLNYKIRELKEQIEPRDRRNAELGEKMQDMEKELINLQKINVSLELQLQELRDKLRGSRRAYEQEIAKNRNASTCLKKIKTDLSYAVELIQEPNSLKNAVIQLHRRYNVDDAEFVRSRDEDARAHCEFARQRDHLEKTVFSLRKQVFRTSGDDDDDDRRETDKLTNDNVQLLVEINALREGLKVSRDRLADMENLLGTNGNQLTPQEARKKLSDACHGREQLENRYRRKLQDCENIVANLSDHVKRLMLDAQRQQSGEK